VSATNSLFAASGNFSQHAMRDGHTVKWIDVPTTTLDRFTDEKAISEVDVLKMDIQGAELLALEGSKRLLAGQHIQLIYAEVSFTDLYEGQCLFHELSARLTSYRYKLFGLYNFEYAPVPSYGLLQADALFFSPEVESALRDPSSG
jgi:hypothetical protein